MTGLCQLPNCRQRNRHLPGCVDDCLGCLPRATDEGIVCTACADRAARHLAEIIEFTEDARAVAHGEVRRSQGGGSGKPGSRSPANDDALDAMDAIQNALTTMAREIAEERGLQLDSAGLGDLSPADPITRAAKWLSVQLSWLRHATLPSGEPYAADVFREIGDCAARMRSLVDGPKEQRFLGPCGADLTFERCAGWAKDLCLSMTEGLYHCDEGECVRSPTATCEGDVYGVAGAQTGRCRTCGATVDQAERRQWLDDEVRQHTYTAAEIAAAYPGIKANTIRQWLSRGLVVARGEYRGRPLLNLGEVLDLAAADAARREQVRTTRDRRRTTVLDAG